MAMWGTLIRACRSCHSVGSLTIESYVLKTNMKYGNFVRTLFTGATIGMESYKRERDKYIIRMGDLKETFLTNMKAYLQESDSAEIFSNDLKTMAHIAETEEDVQMVVQMQKRYNYVTQNQVNVSNFKFGPLLMRMCHNLELPDLAFELFTDKDLSGLFDQVTSIKILMNLLFEKQDYAKVIEVMDLVVGKDMFKGKYTDCATLFIAACTKLNTAEAYQKAKSFVQHVQDSMTQGHRDSPLTVRSSLFMSLLCLNQGYTTEAFEFLSYFDIDKPITALGNMKILLMSELGRTDEVLQVIRNFTVQDHPDHIKSPTFYFFQDVLDKVKESLQKENRKPQIRTLENLCEALKEHGQINYQPFNEYLFRPVIQQRRFQDSFKHNKILLRKKWDSAQEI